MIHAPKGTHQSSRAHSVPARASQRPRHQPTPQRPCSSCSPNAIISLLRIAPLQSSRISDLCKDVSQQQRARLKRHFSSRIRDEEGHGRDMPKHPHAAKQGRQLQAGTDHASPSSLHRGWGALSPHALAHAHAHDTNHPPKQQASHHSRRHIDSQTTCTHTDDEAPLPSARGLYTRTLRSIHRMDRGPWRRTTAPHRTQPCCSGVACATAT